MLAEKFMHGVEKELAGIQIIGESQPFRVGVRKKDFKEAKETRNQLLEKYPNCWILH
jgi:hypothetical protein